jgi:hypothetical protein
MFFNDKVYSEGAVGVAISGVPRSFHIDFPANLKPITPEVIITRCVSLIANLCMPSSLHFHSVEGNLIKSIDNLNPTRVLLKAIETAAIHNFKENDFYLVLVQGGQVRIGLLSIDTSTDISPQKKRVFRITSGDPSRGTISLESHAAPPQGSTVQVRG